MAGTLRKYLSRLYWRSVYRARGGAATLAAKALPSAVPTGKKQSDRASTRTITHPAQALDPSSLPGILGAAENGDPHRLIALFDDFVERDLNLGNLVRQRALAVSGKPYAIVSGGARPVDHRAADMLHEAIASIPNFSGAIQHWLSHVSYSYAASEEVWGTRRRNGRLYVAPVGFTHMHADRFLLARGIARPDGTDEDELLLRTYDTPTGEALAAGQWMVVTAPGARPLIRRGLMRGATWNSAFKLWIEKNWIVYSQRVGIPFALATVQRFNDEISRLVAEEIGENLGEDGFAVIPEGMTVEWKDGARGDSTLHSTLINYFDSQSSKSYYGATLANDNGQGSSSYALGTLHGEVRWENVTADAVTIEDAFRQHVSIPFVAYNGMDAAPPRLVIHIAQSLPPQALVQVADVARNRLGLELSKQQFRELLGFRAPVDDDDALPGATDASAMIAGDTNE